LIDISHDVPRGDIQAAAFMLWQSSPYMPSNTVFLCVVDPGVGSARRGIAAKWGSQICVGPDNGLFSYLVFRDGAPEVIELWDPQVSTTFHGRDIFAPFAARLALDAVFDELGPPVELEKMLPAPRLAAKRSGHIRLDPWLGQEPESQYPARTLAARLPNGDELPFVRTFSDVQEGQGLAYIGSNGLLEIGVNRGSAASALDLQTGQAIQLLNKE
jgi:S-adenosylmethionine hydrolase